MRRPWRYLAIICTLALALVFSGGGRARTADTTSATGDESVAAPAAWFAYTGMTPAAITQALGSTYRLVDIRQAANGTYNVVMVKNSAPYVVSAWWWYYHQAPTQVSTALSSHHARLIAAERNSNGTLNVIMVANTGSAARGWWWYYGVTPSQISAKLNTNHARLVSLSADRAGGGKYTAVMVANSGSDAKTWWWYYGQTAAQVSSRLSTNGARLVDLDVDPSGHFDVVMVKQTGTNNLPWKWYYGTSAGNIVKIALNTGYRVFDLQSYGGGTSFAGLMINNLPAEEHRVEALLESGYSKQGLSGGNFGFLVKRVGLSPSLQFRNDAVFEPASTIKALYNLYAERQVQMGNDSLGSTFYYWFKPTDPTNKDVCPLDYSNTNLNKVATTLKDGLDRMMGVSDNRTTQGVDLRYGRSNVNTYAHIIGMKDTVINQTLGCGTKNGGYVDVTLNDLAKLYQGVQTNALLTPTRASSFFGRMNGGTLGNTDPLATVIKQEAAKRGKSAIAGAFVAATSARDKGGSYDICPSSGNCSPPYVYDRADAGVLTLPFKSSGKIVPRQYLYGWFVNGLSIPCTFSNTTCAARVQADKTTATIRAEEFRAQVIAALKTW